MFCHSVTEKEVTLQENKLKLNSPARGASHGQRSLRTLANGHPTFIFTRYAAGGASPHPPLKHLLPRILYDVLFIGPEFEWTTANNYL